MSSEPEKIYWINLRKAQDKGLEIWRTRSHANFLSDSDPADCIERVVNTKSKEILYQTTSTPRPPPKLVLEEAWQVQRDDYFQRGSGVGKPVADEEKFKIDLSVPGVP